MAQLRAARAVDPASALVLGWMGYGYFLDDRMDSALVESARALENDSTNMSSVGLRARVLLGNNRLAEARRLSDRDQRRRNLAVALRPERSDLRFGPGDTQIPDPSPDRRAGPVGMDRLPDRILVSPAATGTVGNRVAFPVRPLHVQAGGASPIPPSFLHEILLQSDIAPLPRGGPAFTFSELMGLPGGDPASSQELVTGRRDTLDRLMPAVFDELRTIRTVQRDWTEARMLLRRTLEQ